MCVHMNKRSINSVYISVTYFSMNTHVSQRVNDLSEKNKSY